MPKGYTDLVLKAKEGDKEAYGEVYKEFLPKIYRFVYFLVYDEPLAEDITQNTFLKAWNSIDRFSTKKGTFQAFLFTIARNLVIDYQRKKKASPIDSDGEAYLASDEDLEEEYIRRENGHAVRRALNYLPKVDRSLIILRYFEELPYKEIEKVVHKNHGAIRVRIHRALHVLKDHMKNHRPRGLWPGGKGHNGKL